MKNIYYSKLIAKSCYDHSRHVVTIVVCACNETRLFAGFPQATTKLAKALVFLTACTGIIISREVKWTLELFHFAAFLLLKIRSQKRSLHRSYLYKMDKIWDHLSACNEQEFLLTTRLLLALLHNIIQDPQNDKHRRLRASSKVGGKTMQRLIIDTYKKPCKPAAIWLCKYFIITIILYIIMYL